ncbi:MAG: Universal stress protein family [Chloroflexi bacterium]|nr:Universal stress protein family [Chloroflexota bacterium]
MGADACLQARGAAAHRIGAWRTQASLGSAAPEILAAAKSENADLIVLATHGLRGLDWFAYGSVARELLHLAEVPLMILPGKAARAAAPEERGSVTQTSSKSALPCANRPLGLSPECGGRSEVL